MFKEQGILFLYTESPLHAGSGSSVGSIDLPIQRERFTQFPIIQSSGVKGALRDLARGVKDINKKDFLDFNKIRLIDETTLTTQELDKKKKLEEKILPFEIVFGPETDRAQEHAGALALTDAQILLFPIRSLVGVFAWVTCPMVLDRFKRDLKRIKPDYNELDKINFFFDKKNDLDKDKAFVGKKCTNQLPNQNKLILEDFAFVTNNEAKPEEENLVDQLAKWLVINALPTKIASTYWGNKLQNSLIVVHDDVFLNFVRFAIDVVFRIHIGETGTVEEGALWSEERVPAETLFYTLSMATDPRIQNKYISNSSDALDYLTNEIIGQAPSFQIGGNETIGCGLVQSKFLLNSHLQIKR